MHYPSQTLRLAPMGGFGNYGGGLGERMGRGKQTFALARGFEWARSHPIWLLSADVLSAFDHMHPDLVADSLRFSGVYPGLIAAFLRERTDSRMRTGVTLPSCTTSYARRARASIPACV